MKKLKIILQCKVLLYCILFITIIVSYYRANNYKYENIDVDNLKYTLLEYEINGDSFNCILKSGNKKYKGIYYIKSEKEKQKLERLNKGITISLKGNISIPNNNTIPNTFNYKLYLKSNNIFYTIKIDNFKIKNNKINIIFMIKNNLEKYINKFQSSNYLNTFILGNKKELDEEVTSKYQSLGIIHIFAISGMHISILTGILLFLLKRIKDNIKYFIIIFFLIFYIFLTNFQCSVERSIVLFTFLYLNKLLDFNLDTESVFILSIIFILIVNYYFIINIGFLYSSIISYILVKFNYLIKGNYIKKMIIVSLMSLLVSLPITINSNYEFNLLCIIYNLFYIPLISFIIYPLSLITLIIKPLDYLLFKILSLLELITLNAIELKIILPKMNIILIIIYYICVYLFLKTYNKKIILLILIILLFNKYKYFLNNNLYITYLDVNQGDSTIINYKNKVILIDTGGKVEYQKEEWRNKNTKYYYTSNIIKYIKSKGINYIDYLVLTHGDYDHMGEAVNLVNNFKVNNVIFNNNSYNDLETKLIKVLNEKNIKYYKGLKSLNIGNEKLYFLNTKEYDNENDNSNVIYLNFKKYKFLFMGDAGVEREKDILDKYNLTNIDFIKIGHHGSNTSSSKNFIDSIKPKKCLISVGKNNRYNHPKDSVIDILDDYCDIYRTDLNGSVEIKINQNNYKIKTYNS